MYTKILATVVVSMSLFSCNPSTKSEVPREIPVEIQEDITQVMTK